MELNIKGPEFDENFFDPAKKSPYFHRFGYSRGEMVNIMTDYLDWFSMPACRESILLLRAIIRFYDQTDTDVLSFKLTQSHEIAKEPFESITKALEHAINKLHTLNRESSDFKFFNLAINYSVEALRRRLTEIYENLPVAFEDFDITSSLENILEKQHEEKKEI